MKTYKAIVKDKSTKEIKIIESEATNKKEFIHDLRRNGYAVNERKAKEKEVFEYIMTYTDCNPWDWDIKKPEEKKKIKQTFENVVEQAEQFIDCPESTTFWIKVTSREKQLLKRMLKSLEKKQENEYLSQLTRIMVESAITTPTQEELDIIYGKKEEEEEMFENYNEEIESHEDEIIECLAEADKEAMSHRATEVNVCIDGDGKPYKTYNNAGSGFLPEEVWKGEHIHVKTFCYESQSPEDWIDNPFEYITNYTTEEEDDMILQQEPEERLEFIKEHLPHLYEQYEQELIDDIVDFGLQEGCYEGMLHRKLEEMQA